MFVIGKTRQIGFPDTIWQQTLNKFMGTVTIANKLKKTSTELKFDASGNMIKEETLGENERILKIQEARARRFGLKIKNQE